MRSPAYTRIFNKLTKQLQPGQNSSGDHLSVSVEVPHSTLGFDHLKLSSSSTMKQFGFPVASRDETSATASCDGDVKVFACRYCNRSFRNSQALGGHQNAHRRERRLLKLAQFYSDHLHHQQIVSTDCINAETAARSGSLVHYATESNYTRGAAASFQYCLSPPLIFSPIGYCNPHFALQLPQLPTVGSTVDQPKAIIENKEGDVDLHLRLAPSES